MVEEKSAKKIFALNLFITCITFILLSALLYLSVKNRTDLVNKKNTLTALNYDLEKLDTIVSQKDILQTAGEKISQSLPRTYQEVSQAISNIENIAEKSKLAVELDLDEYAIGEFSDISSVRIQIKSQGSYTAHESFLREISGLPYQIRIDRIQMDSSEGTINSSTTIRLFIQKKIIES